MPEEKSEAEEQALQEQAKTQQVKPWWSFIPWYFWVGGLVIIFLIIRNIQIQYNSTMIWLIIAVLIILYLLSRKYTDQLRPLLPWEAEIIVEKELQRKIEWGQLPQNTKFYLTPINRDFRSDAEGIFYAIGATLILPYTHMKLNTEARVIKKGVERGYCTFSYNVWELTGREPKPQKRILGDVARDMKQLNILDKVLMRGGLR